MKLWCTSIWFVVSLTVVFAQTNTQTVISGGIRTGQLTQEILPVAPRNPYWYTFQVNEDPSSPINVTSSFSINSDLNIKTTRTADLYHDLSHTLIRGMPRQVFYKINTNAASRIERNRIIDEGESEVIKITALSGSITRDINYLLSGEITYEYEFRQGTLGKHMTDQVSSATNAYDYTVDSRQMLVDSGTGFTAMWSKPSTHVNPSLSWQAKHPEFSFLFNLGTRTVSRNPNFFLKDVDLSYLSIWNSRENNRRAGTLVTTKHFISANHFSPENGDTMIFMGMDGQIHSNTVAKTVSLGNDLRINELASEVPSFIKPCDVMSGSWTNYFGVNANDGYRSIYRGKRFGWEDGNDGYRDGQGMNPLIFHINQMKCADINEMNRSPGSVVAPLVSDKDSGSPEFAMINGKAVLLFTHTGTSFGPPPGDPQMLPLINAQIAIWGSTQTVNEVNLSGFNTY